MNTDLLKQWVFVIIRYASPFVTAWLAAHFNIASPEAATWVATTVAILWGLVNKYRYETKVNTALDLPKGSDKADLKDVIAAGNGTSATVAK